MNNPLEALKEYLGEIADLTYAASTLSWDTSTYMPPGATEGRSRQSAALARIIHSKFTSDETGRMLEELEPLADEYDPDSHEARLIRLTAKRYRKLQKVPNQWVSEFSRLTSKAHHAWAEARAADDFEHFRPYIEEVFEMRRTYAGFFAPYEHIYDPLLDDYEPGMKTEEVQQIFNTLRPQQVELIRELNERKTVNNSFLYQYFDEKKQWDFGVEVITKFGYDWDHGRQDYTAHPFTSRLGPGDVRITTRVEPEYLGSGLFATLHECGHALHGLGFDPALVRTPLGARFGVGSGGASQAISESQSRLWENQVGRSFEFWQHFYPRLQEMFPQQLGQVTLEAFYKGVNVVKPSLIRVEADEGTYNLHIMLRLELEIDLITGALAARDLPEAWRARMEEYLGVTPPDNADGVLQDVHWSWGMVGYFPTYALGNVVSAQLWETIQAEIPNLKDQIGRGEFGELLGWLREKIHQHGTKFTAQEMVQRATGSKIDPAPYMRYLKDKYYQVYA